jgi:cytochrome c
MINRLVSSSALTACFSRGVKPYLMGFALIVALLVVGCGQGTYPLDIFYEMHYQQTFKSHEPPRLSGPESAVPVNWVPAPKSTSFNTGEHLFNVNCAMCHGATAKGDGRVLKKMIADYGYTPAVDPDLTSTGVMAMGTAGMMGFMKSGVVVMPNFTKLLTTDEMDLIAEYVVTLQ